MGTIAQSDPVSFKTNISWADTTPAGQAENGRGTAHSRHSIAACAVIRLLSRQGRGGYTPADLAAIGTKTQAEFYTVDGSASEVASLLQPCESWGGHFLCKTASGSLMSALKSIFVVREARVVHGGVLLPRKGNAVKHNHRLLLP